MYDYPPGAENDPRAPYNQKESCSIFECDEDREYESDYCASHSRADECIDGCGRLGQEEAHGRCWTCEESTAGGSA